MKKLSILLIASTLLLSACSSLTLGEAKTEALKDGNVTTYLVLSKNGLYNNEKGENVPSLFLENTISYSALPGSALPTAEEITSSVKDSTFVSWISYEGKGTPTKHETVPTKNGEIYYAFFEGKSSGDPDVPTEFEWYVVGDGSFLNEGASWSVASGIGMTTNTNYSGDGKEYMLLGQSFEDGDLWKLCTKDQSTWISSGWETSAGALKSGSMSLVSDGVGGNNVKVNTTGTYDIYFKVYTSGSYSCYIGESN